MKKIINLTIVFLYFNNSYSQVKEIFYEIENIEHIRESKGYVRGIYELSLIIHKNSNDFDNYQFIANCDETKSFTDNGIEFVLSSSLQLYKRKDFEVFSSCDLHDFLSGKSFNILYRNKNTNKYKKWIFIYRGTAKNTINTNSNNRI